MADFELTQDQRLREFVKELDTPPEKRSPEFRQVLETKDRRSVDYSIRARLINHAYHVHGKGNLRETAKVLDLESPKIRAVVTGTTIREPEVLNALVERKLDETELELTSGGVAGVIEKLDNLASKAYEKLVERIDADEEMDSKVRKVVDTKDLNATLRLSLEEIREIMFRVQKRKQEADASALSDADLQKKITGQNTLLKAIGDVTPIDVE